MAILKQAKMTQKTQRTIETASEVLGVNPAYLRKDRKAIDEMTTILENEGYEWIPAKQEWAKIMPPLPLVHLRHFVLLTTPAEADTILLLVQAGAEALGVAVKLMEKIETADEQGIMTSLLCEMTE